MDNRLNKIRKEMNLLREEMLRAEADMHDRIARGGIRPRRRYRCWNCGCIWRRRLPNGRRLGGLAHLPTVEERLKERREPLARPRLYVVPIRKAQPALQKVSPPRAKKRRLAVRA